MWHFYEQNVLNFEAYYWNYTIHFYWNDATFLKWISNLLGLQRMCLYFKFQEIRGPLKGFLISLSLACPVSKMLRAKSSFHLFALYSFLIHFNSRSKLKLFNNGAISPELIASIPLIWCKSSQPHQPNTYHIIIIDYRY